MASKAVKLELDGLMKVNNRTILVSTDSPHRMFGIVVHAIQSAKENL
jgi:hypothetical protein